MTLLATLKVALAALRTNKLRSALTMLGIIIGVGAVITMIAIGGGAQQRVEEQLKSLGSNVMLVLPGGRTASGVRLGAQSGQGLTEEDAQAMEQWLRRIPDDPGGLLRRKFLYEHQRRGEPASESESW